MCDVIHAADSFPDGLLAVAGGGDGIGRVIGSSPAIFGDVTDAGNHLIDGSRNRLRLAINVFDDIHHAGIGYGTLIDRNRQFHCAIKLLIDRGA